MDKKLIKRLLDICYKNQLHHLGSYFSCVETIDDVYSEMNTDDIFILSNGHASVALYVVLEKHFNFDDFISRWDELFTKIHEEKGSWQNREGYVPYEVREF